MTTTAAATVTDIHHLVKADFEQVNALIEENLYSHIELISAVSQYIIHSGGKRLRPLVTLLSARALGYSGQDHVRLAVVIEFLHTATLLHDDVVDGSTLRRGRQTANVVWGNSASVLVGDFLYSRAFQLMTLLGSLPIYTILANATNTIAQGEVLQLIRRHNVNLSLQDYLDVIRCKTAMLFAAATESGAVVAGASAATQQALSAYGLHLGMAFQMIDDWLDYAVTADDSGKNPGDDLVEGKVTLPLIYAMQKATPAEQQFIRDTLQHGKAENLPAILDILKTTNAGHYVQQDAQAQAELAKQALAGLADTSHKQALIDLADLAVQRRS
jgi:octaprenyl-diphosphate synthase